MKKVIISSSLIIFTLLTAESSKGQAASGKAVAVVNSPAEQPVGMPFKAAATDSLRTKVSMPDPIAAVAKQGKESIVPAVSAPAKLPAVPNQDGKSGKE
jgi:hypothetical protein